MRLVVRAVACAGFEENHPKEEDNFSKPEEGKAMKKHEVALDKSQYIGV